MIFLQSKAVVMDLILSCITNRTCIFVSSYVRSSTTIIFTAGSFVLILILSYFTRFTGILSSFVLVSVDLSSLKILAITDVVDNTDNTDDSDGRRRRRMQSKTATSRNLASKGIEIDYEIRTNDVI